MMLSNGHKHANRDDLTTHRYDFPPQPRPTSAGATAPLQREEYQHDPRDGGYNRVLPSRGVNDERVNEERLPVQQRDAGGFEGGDAAVNAVGPQRPEHYPLFSIEFYVSELTLFDTETMEHWLTAAQLCKQASSLEEVFLTGDLKQRPKPEEIVDLRRFFSPQGAGPAEEFAPLTKDRLNECRTLLREVTAMLRSMRAIQRGLPSVAFQRSEVIDYGVPYPELKFSYRLASTRREDRVVRLQEWLLFLLSPTCALSVLNLHATFAGLRERYHRLQLAAAAAGQPIRKLLVAQQSVLPQQSALPTTTTAPPPPPQVGFGSLLVPTTRTATPLPTGLGIPTAATTTSVGSVLGSTSLLPMPKPAEAPPGPPPSLAQLEAPASRQAAAAAVAPTDMLSLADMLARVRAGSTDSVASAAAPMTNGAPIVAAPQPEPASMPPAAAPLEQTWPLRDFPTVVRTPLLTRPNSGALATLGASSLSTAEAVPQPKPQADYRTRVVRLLQQYSPSHLASTDALLEKHIGREDELIRLLTERLGPETPTTATPALDTQVAPLGAPAPSLTVLAPLQAAIAPPQQPPIPTPAATAAPAAVLQPPTQPLAVQTAATVVAPTAAITPPQPERTLQQPVVSAAQAPAPQPAVPQPTVQPVPAAVPTAPAAAAPLPQPEAPAATVQPPPSVPITLPFMGQLSQPAAVPQQPQQAAVVIPSVTQASATPAPPAPPVPQPAEQQSLGLPLPTAVPAPTTPPVVQPPLQPPVAVPPQPAVVAPQAVVAPIPAPTPASTAATSALPWLAATQPPASIPQPTPAAPAPQLPVTTPSPSVSPPRQSPAEIMAAIQAGATLSPTQPIPAPAAAPVVAAPPGAVAAVVASSPPTVVQPVPQPAPQPAAVAAPVAAPMTVPTVFPTASSMPRPSASPEVVAPAPQQVVAQPPPARLLSFDGIAHPKNSLDALFDLSPPRPAPAAEPAAAPAQAPAAPTLAATVPTTAQAPPPESTL